MFDPREEIQIIGINTDDEDLYARRELEEWATNFNETMRLKNRYNRAVEKLERIEQELEDKIKFCEMEAEGTVNDTHCRIAIIFYKKLLDIIREG